MFLVGLILTTLSLSTFAASIRSNVTPLVILPAQLSARSDDGTFAINNVHGILKITVENASVISISDYRRVGTTVYIRVSRLGGGDTLLHLRDGRGAIGTLPVEIGGCSWPQPQFDMLFPANVAVLNAAERYSATFSYSATGLITRSGLLTDQDLIVAENQLSPPNALGSEYRARLWSRDGDIRESENLEQISEDQVPRALREGDASLANATFFKASVHNLLRNTSYSVQIWNPTGHCPPPIDLGAIMIP